MESYQAIKVLKMVEAHGLADDAKNEAILALEKLEKVKRLLEVGYFACVHHDYRAWRFMHDLEEIVGSINVDELYKLAELKKLRWIERS